MKTVSSYFSSVTLSLALISVMIGAVPRPTGAADHTNASACTTSARNTDPGYMQSLGGVNTYTFYPCKLQSDAVEWRITVTNANSPYQQATCNLTTGTNFTADTAVCTGIIGTTIKVKLEWKRAGSSLFMPHYHYFSN